ncbi:MAG: FAD-binding oxidoreductase [Phycisphaerales bacterium]
MSEVKLSKTKYKIVINDKKEIEADEGKSLLSTLLRQKIHIPTSCGGKGKCGLCKLRVAEGADILQPAEETLLNDYEKQSNIRLSCQVKVQNNLKIFIPPEILNVREYNCQCTDIKDLTYDIKEFRFELNSGDTLNYIPGQYMQLQLPLYASNNQRISRAYSISSDPKDINNFEFIIRKVPDGICTTYCFEYLKKGDKIKIKGPYGQFSLTQNHTPIIFIAGGSGIAPIKSMLHQMKNTGNKRKATFYFGANRVKDLCCIDLMSRFEKEIANFRFVPAVASSDPGEKWDGQTGLVTKVFRDDYKDATGCEAYLCGSPGMIDASIKVLKEIGVKEENIFYDKFE